MVTYESVQGHSRGAAFTIPILSHRQIYIKKGENNYEQTGNYRNIRNARR